MSDTSEKTAREAMEKSRIEVMKCEEEIKIIKNGIKAAVAKANNSNSLNVSVHKVKPTSAEKRGSGEEDTAADDDSPTTFKVHLSSPIEERTITQLFDPLNPTADESLAIFESVETSNALLTVEAYSSKDASSKLVSAAHDLLPLCQDMELWRKGGEKKTTTLEIAVVAEKGIDDVDDEDKKVDISADSESWEDAVEEEIEKDEETKTEEKEDAPKEETEEKKDDIPKEETEKKDEAPATTDESVEKESPAQDESKAAATIQLPLYTLTIQLEYTPSSNDLRDSLYEALNEVSKRKVAAIESLRKNAGLVNRAKASEASTSGSGEVVKSGPAVKAGFLNKKPSEAAQPFWKRWYNKTIGPQSMLWVVGPIAKNYVIFAGVSLFIHWKGDLLALPAPL